MNKTHKNLGLTYKVLSALFAFMLWGGWAYIINAQAEGLHRVKVALAQGTSSFIITMVMVDALELLYSRFEQHRMVMILPTLITLSVTSSGLTLIHYFIGTPKIFYTIAPALSVAFLFCLFTTFQLHRQVI